MHSIDDDDDACEYNSFTRSLSLSILLPVPVSFALTLGGISHSADYLVEFEFNLPMFVRVLYVAMHRELTCQFKLQ